jgi:hypothetical protein
MNPGNWDWWEGSLETKPPNAARYYGRMAFQPGWLVLIVRNSSVVGIELVWFASERVMSVVTGTRPPSAMPKDERYEPVWEVSGT